MVHQIKINMKKPYINKFEREMIRSGTISGDYIMLRFRIQQLKKAIFNAAYK